HNLNSQSEPLIFYDWLFSIDSNWRISADPNWRFSTDAIWRISPDANKGAFADIKADMNFRRFLCRGTENALVAVDLLAMAHNIQKLHHKIQHGTASRHRIPVKEAA
ncbi:MAG: transposase, partial [Selenomonas sp.]|uniref:transposase n=1 Tax=Selenomonas sp. TaxID=2053611 RepID=UPI0025D41A5C